MDQAKKRDMEDENYIFNKSELDIYQKNICLVNKECTFFLHTECTQKSIINQISLIRQELPQYQNQIKSLQKTLQINISYKQRCKNFQQDISKLNPTMYKRNYTLQPSGTYSRYAWLIQHSKIN